MVRKSRGLDNTTPTLPASVPPAADCASDLAASLPAGAPLSFAPQLIDSSLEIESLGGPQLLPTLKQRYADTERICPTGKVPFLTQRAALQMLKTFKKRRDEWREKNRHLTVYQCREAVCQRWHIGNLANFEEGWEDRPHGRRPRNLPSKTRQRRKEINGRRKS